MDDRIFMIKARRCEVCGRILTSAQSVAEGYGSSCKQHARRKAAQEEELRDQCSLFDLGDREEDTDAGQ